MDNIKKHNNLIDSIRLILSVLLFENKISKLTFDKLSEYLKGTSDNYPTYDDFFKEILLKAHSIPIPASEMNSSSTGAFPQRYHHIDVKINGQIYDVTLKPKG